MAFGRDLVIAVVSASLWSMAPTIAASADDLSSQFLGMWGVYEEDPTGICAERSGKSTVVVIANTKTGKWETSLWDFFRDQTFAVVGHHDDGTIKPTRFEFLRS